MPEAAVFWAMRHFVNISPRPKLDLVVWTYSDISEPGWIRGITLVPSSEGLPLYIPSTLLRMNNFWLSIIDDIKPDNSSLSVNIKAVTETESFSLITGNTLLSHNALMQLRIFK